VPCFCLLADASEQGQVQAPPCIPNLLRRERGERAKKLLERMVAATEGKEEGKEEVEEVEGAKSQGKNEAMYLL
jgi:hypothetical protein